MAWGIREDDQSYFSVAQKMDHCIVFSDEADAAFKTSSSDEQERYRNIRKLDGLVGGRGKSVMVILAANRPDNLSPAVLRRVPRRVHVDLPALGDRRAIREIQLKDKFLAVHVSLAALAQATPSHGGSDLKNLSVAAAFACIYEEGFGAVKPENETRKERPLRRHRKENLSRRKLCARHFDKATEEVVRASSDRDALSEMKRFGKIYRDNV